MIWFLWHINHCRLFNAKSFLYTYIRYIWFVKHILLVMFLNEPKLIFLHTVKWFQQLLSITNNSIKHQSFLYPQINDQTVLFLAIQFSISHLVVLCLNIKQFYLTHRYCPIRCYHSGPESTWEWWQWRGTLHSPKLQHYWSLLIRLFSVITGYSLGES